MRMRTVAALSFAGMLLTSASVYSLTPPKRAAAAEPVVPEAAARIAAVPDEVASSFDAGTTLRVGGRVGHSRLRTGSNGETYVLLEVRAGEGDSAARAGSSHLAIVIDRSGSMKGDRIRNALAGAIEAVDRLADGDVVSVVAFDTTTTTVVPATALGPDNRAGVRAAIGAITLGGDTCISCGMEEGMRELSRTSGKVDRMILLSDGEATAGVRDLDGFRAIAERARAQGVAVTTIGVGVSYNQKVLGGIAQKGGGQHYFVENTASLEQIFQAEAEQLRATVARDATATIELGEGVELRGVMDRSFERQGQRVTVSLGSFARNEEKTVLLRVRVPTRDEGRLPVASVSLDYADLLAQKAGRCEGRLEAKVGAEQSEIDGVVGGRVERSRTAMTLLEANELISQGKLEEARQRLAAQQTELAASAERARAAAPPSRKADVAQDFARQSGSLSTAASAIARPAHAPRAVRSNQTFVNRMML